jgi:hypothetical protein
LTSFVFRRTANTFFRNRFIIVSLAATEQPLRLSGSILAGGFYFTPQFQLWISICPALTWLRTASNGVEVRHSGRTAGLLSFDFFRNRFIVVSLAAE